MTLAGLNHSFRRLGGTFASQTRPSRNDGQPYEIEIEDLQKPHLGQGVGKRQFGLPAEKLLVCHGCRRAIARSYAAFFEDMALGDPLTCRFYDRRLLAWSVGKFRGPHAQILLNTNTRQVENHLPTPRRPKSSPKRFQGAG